MDDLLLPEHDGPVIGIPGAAAVSSLAGTSTVSFRASRLTRVASVALGLQGGDGLVEASAAARHLCAPVLMSLLPRRRTGVHRLQFDAPVVLQVGEELLLHFHSTQNRTLVVYPALELSPHESCGSTSARS